MASGEQVFVYIYDMSQGMARAMSMPLLGKQLDGIWHTSIVVFSTEYFYGGTEGIASCQPGGTVLGQPQEKVSLGFSQIPREIFMEFLQQLGLDKFSASKYDLFHRNCNDFSQEVATFLTGQSIPSKITALPQEVLSTPLGAMIKPMLDSFTIQPGRRA